MIDGPFERFCNELDALVDAWCKKPEDDRLTVGQIIGAIEFLKFNLMQEARDAHTQRRTD